MHKVQIQGQLGQRHILQKLQYIAGTPEVGGPGGHVPPQVLGYQLTLFGPRGQIMPAILLLCPPIILDDVNSCFF